MRRERGRQPGLLWGRSRSRISVIGALSVSLMAFGVNGNLVLANAARGPGPGPGQQSGTAAGRGHYVDDSVTRAGGGNGRAPRHAKGELGDFVRRHPTVRPFATGADQRGFDESTRKRVAGKSGARMDFFTDANGRMQAHFSAARLNYRNAKGDYNPINTSLTRRSGGFTTSSFEGRFGGTADDPRYAETANDIDVEVAGRANDPNLVSLGPDDTHSVGQALSGAAPAAGQVNGSDISYSNVFPDTDLIISALTEGFRDTLVLRSANAPTSFTFPLELQGLTASINDAGGVDYRDAGGNVVAASPHGHMNDSAPDETGEGARSQGVTYTLITVDGKPAIRVDLDADWLHQPLRKFPVRVDPATYTDQGDTYADTTTPATDHSGDSSMGMGIPSSNRLARSYIKFSLQNAPSGAHTTSATLHLWLTYVTTCSAQTFEVRSIRSAWTPTGTTTYSATQPQAGNTILGSATPAVSTNDACGNSPVDTNKGKNVDVALGVNANMGTFDTWNPNNYGLMLKAPDETLPYNGSTFSWKRFDTDNSAHPPTLDVTYAGNQIPQVDDRAVGSLNTLTPELQVNAHDPDQFPNATLQYQFRVFNATDDPNATSPAPTPVADSGRISGSDWVVPAGKLSWSTDYVWTVQLFDGQDVGPPNGYLVPKPFTPTIRQPVIGSTLTKAAGEHGFDSNTGNLTTTATDTTVTTVGPALAIKRSYNSRDARSTGLFGAGWSTQLDMTLTELKDPAGSAVTGALLTYEDGQQAGFSKDSTGAFTPGEGFFGTLTAVSGGYTYTDNNTTTWTFTHAWTGQPGSYGLTSVTDGPGHVLSYTWTGDQITKATAASGRSLTFTWTTPSAGYSAHVATVTTDRAVAADPNSALVWSYTYSGDRLTKVCPPISSTACTVYGYQDGSHYPTVVLDSDPYAYWRFNEPANSPGPIDSVVDNEGSLNASYTSGVGSGPSPVANGATTAATFNGTNTWMTVPTVLGFGLYTNSLSLWFKTSTPDRVLAGMHDDALFNGTTTAGYIPDLYIGTDGKLRGQLGWGGSARPITTTGSVTDGQWHQAVITSQAATATETLYLDGAKVGTLNQSGYLWRPTPYSPSSFLSAALTIGAGFIGGSWPGQSHTGTATATYFNGSISDVAVHNRALSPAEVAAAYAAAKAGPAALLTSVTTPAGHTTLTVPATYTVPLPPGTQGTPTSVNGWDVVRDAVNAVTDNNGGTWALAAPTVSGSSTGLVGAVRTAKPLAYWRLGEGVATQAVDDSGDVTHLAGYNNVTLGQTGPFGVGDATAAAFDGASSQVNAPATIDLANKTANSVSLWFKTSTAGGVLFGYSGAPVGSGTVASSVPYTPALYVGTDGKLYGAMWNGTVNPIVSQGTVTDGKWHQATLTNAGSGGNQYLYLDGLQVTDGSGNVLSRPGGAALATSPNNTFGAGFAGRSWPAQPYGSSSLGTPWRFTGTMAEISVYTKALSTNQVYLQWLAYQKSTTTYPVKTIVVSDPLGNLITDRYDPEHLDRILSHTDSLGHTTAMGYDTRGFRNSVSDGMGNSVEIGHDVRGNPLTQVDCQNDAQNKCSTSTWTMPTNNGTLGAANDKPTKFQDPRTTGGPNDATYETDTTYNNLGLPISVAGPLIGGARQTTTTTYTDANTVADGGGGHPPIGLPATVTDPGGGVTSTTYSAAGDVSSVTNPLGLIMRYTYDGLGRILTSTEVSTAFPGGLTTTFVYDGLGRVTQRTDPGVTDNVTGVVHTGQTTTTYDADSFVVTATVADLTGGDLPRSTSAQSDGYGRTQYEIDAAGSKTSYLYDVFGNRTQVKKADGRPYSTTTVSSYDSEHHLLTVTLKNFAGDSTHPAGDLVTESRAYDRAGRLASSTNVMGWTTTYSYLDNGSPAKITRSNGIDPAYEVESDSYSADGRLATRWTNNGVTKTDYTYDADGRQATITVDAAGLNRVTTYTYDSDDHVASTKVSDGTTTQIIDAKWDKAGNQIEQDVHNGATVETTTWSRDNRGLLVSMTDPLGRVTSYLNDEAGHQVAVIDTSVATESGVEGAAPVNLTPITRTGYNTFGDQHSAQDANGNRTLTEYDGDGRVTSITRPAYTPPGGSANLPSVTTIAYDDLGQALTEVDALGNQTSRTFDQLGNMLTRVAPGGKTTTFTYDSAGDLLSTTTPTGAITRSTWDWMGRKLTETKVERTPAANLTTNYIYGGATYGVGGWLLQETSPTGLLTKYGYDAAGERTSVTDPANNTITYGYDVAGRQISTRWPDGTVHKASVDINGNQTGTTDLDHTGATLRTTSATFDADGRQLTATDARGNTTTWTRDVTGAVVSQVEPVASGSTITTTFAHDAVGNQTRYTDGRGNAFLTTYNSWNLPEIRTEPSTPAHPNAADRTWTTGYDAMGRAAKIVAPGGVTTTRTWDVRGNLLTEAGTGADAPTSTRTFGYDDDDRMTSTFAPGGTDTFTRDDRGDLLSTTGPSGAATFTYNGDGKMVTRADAAGTSTYTWDTTTGRLNAIADPATGVTQTRTYDTLNRLSGITYGSGGATRTETYDDLHRLVDDKLKAPGGATEAEVSYAYDVNDNQISKTTVGTAAPGADTYTYDQANRLSSWTHPGNATVNYTYDASGNRTGNGARTQIFDARNRITSATDSGGTTTYTWTPRGTLAAASGAVTRTATYDAFDQVATDTATGSGASGPQAYTYDALGRELTAGPTGSGTGPSNALSYSGEGNDIAADTSTTYALDPDGKLIASHNTTGGLLAFTDRHDDNTAAFTATGTTPTASVSYDPNGAVTAHVATMPGALGYQSGWTDPDTGQVDMWHRRYDPTTSTFDSRDVTDNDPTPASVGGNRYAYALDSPLGRTDPTGLTSEPATALGRLSTGLAAVAADTKIDASIASGLRPVRSLARPQVDVLERINGTGIYPLLKAAAFCSSDWTGPLCKYRHRNPSTLYTDGTPCQNSLSACIISFFVAAAEGLLFRYGLSGGTRINVVRSARIVVVADDTAAGLGRVTADEIAGVLGATTAAGSRLTTLQLLQNIAQRAQILMGPGSGAVYGTRVHTIFSTEIKALGRSDLLTEVSYLNGELVKYGTRGSVRVDVLEGTEEAPRAIYDLKTGTAKLTAKQIEKIRKHLPKGHQDIPILEVKVKPS
jgi:RHS repeat-associated protein